MVAYFIQGLNELAQEVRHISASKGFARTTDETFPRNVMLVVTELAEAVEDHRANKDTLYFEADGKPCGVASELADAVIRILDISAGMNIDLAYAIHAKVKYNATRPAMHGGKRY